MARAYVDRYGTGFQVTVFTGIMGRRSVYCDNKDNAIAIAKDGAGGTGVVIDITDMRPDQVAEHRSRMKRLEGIVTRGSQF